MAFGQHLSAYQYAGLAAVHFFQYGLNAAFALGAVSVDADNRCVGKQLGQGVFRALGALADGFEVFTPAFRARVAGRHLIIAVVASHGSVATVVGQPSVAPGAFLYVA